MKKMVGAFLGSVLVFWLSLNLEFDLLNPYGSSFLQAVVFSVILFISITRPQIRKIFQITLFIFLVLSALIYSFGQIMLANSVASLVIGSYLIILPTYLPELWSKGCIEP